MATTALAVGAAGCLLYFGRPAFIPVAYALLFSMLLSPTIDALERLRIPRSLTSFLSVILVIALLGAALDAAWAPARDWLDNAPRTLQVIERKVRPVQKLIARIEGLTTRAGSLTDAPAPNAAGHPATVVAAPANDRGVLEMTRTALVSIVTVAILTIFLLVGGPPTLQRLDDAFAVDGRKNKVVQIAETVRNELSRYFATIGLINLGLGFVTAGVMALWGLPSPWLWGMMATVLNFIPYIGPAITLAVLTLVAFVTFQGFGPALGVAGSFLAITTVEGQVVQPLFVGHRMNLNPIVVFLALWFGGWFWGISGVLFAGPALISLKAIAGHFQGCKPLMAVLSGGPEPKRVIADAEAAQ